MNISEFCDEYGRQPSKTHRVVRSRVLEAITGVDDPSEEDILNAATKRWEFGNMGLAVSKPIDQKRIEYEVYEPEKLDQWLTEQFGGTAFLTDTDKQTLLTLAEIALDIKSYRSASGGRKTISDQMRDRLRDILRRAGRR